MRKKLINRGRIAVLFVIVAVGFALILSAVSMLIRYKNEIAERSSATAKYYTLTARNALEDCLEKYMLKAGEIAFSLTDDAEDVPTYLKSFVEDDSVKFSRYFDKEGNFHDSDGSVYPSDKDPSVGYYAEKPDKVGYVGTFDDDLCVESGTMSVVGFYAPVTRSASVSGIVNYYTRQNLVEAFKNRYKSEKAEFSVVCGSDGRIVSGLEESVDAQIFVFLQNKFGTKDVADKVKDFLQKGESGTVVAGYGDDKYLISVDADKENLTDIAIVEMYRLDVLFESSYALIRSTVFIIVLFAVIVAGVTIYLVVFSSRLKKRILNMETNDLTLGCLNRAGFEKTAEKILNLNKTSYFAIVIARIKHFRRFKESFSESEINDLLKYVKLVCSKTVRNHETYGHGEDGEFFLLLHAKDRQEVIERLKVHDFLAGQYKGTSNFGVSLKYGVYEYDVSENATLSQRVDFAKEAIENGASRMGENANSKVNFYSDELREIRIANESMELRMDYALKNGEFQVFYQPKYNLNLNRQDGCEALVRWYDAKEDRYNKPALFMSLFESNGFIVKLDKYVYKKVCEYISYSVSKGKKVFPVSVNVSRVTAIQTGFIDAYVGIKKKYHIPDGLIVIEFTESFAYENYKTLLPIVNSLHENGFKCSIDDFGCGYSSYQILKNLPMDEVKLDKVFLEKGTSPEKDDYVFESVVELGKKIGMKVTQEGVETARELERIRKLGCDAVQGYYYSHPLGLTDYMNFVDRTYEHNI